MYFQIKTCEFQQKTFACGCQCLIWLSAGRFERHVTLWFYSTIVFFHVVKPVETCILHLTFQCNVLFFTILMTAIGGRPKPEFCFLLGQLRWTLLPKERCGNSLSGRGSNTQPSN